MRVLIVDDERPARLRLRQLLQGEEDIGGIHEAPDGEAAVEIIRTERPDVVFLDVQMPGMNGFDVVAAVGVESMPPVVFVTAFDRYAVQAFEVHAVDYLLKPFDRDRFRDALCRVRHRAHPDTGPMAVVQRLENLLGEIHREASCPDRLLVKTRSGMQYVRVDEIDWIEAAANYVVLHVGAREHMLRERIGQLEKTLDTRRFRRCHRSAIVNIDAVTEIQPLFHGEYAIILKNGRRLTLSRTYRDRFLAGPGLTR